MVGFLVTVPSCFTDDHLLAIFSHDGDLMSLPMNNPIRGESTLIISFKSSFLPKVFPLSHIICGIAVSLENWSRGVVQNFQSTEKSSTYLCEIYRLKSEASIHQKNLCAYIHTWDCICGNCWKEKNFWCTGSLFRKTWHFQELTENVP